MKHFLPLLLLLLAAAAPPPAPPPAPVPPVPPSASTTTPAEARRVLDVLNDPKKRADFTATLEAIAKSMPLPPPEQTTAPPAPDQLGIPLEPDSLGAELLVSASGFLGRVGDRAMGALHAIRAIPQVWDWAVMMATDPLGQAQLVDTAWRLAVVFAVGLAVEWLVARVLRRPIALLDERALPVALEKPEPDETGEARAEHGDVEPPPRRKLLILARIRLLPGIIGRLALELVPVICFAISAHLVAGGPIGDVYLTRLVLLAVIDAYAVSRVIIFIGRRLLSPTHRRQRLLPISDATAAGGLRWVRRLTLVCVYGYAGAEVGLLLGLTGATHDAVLKVVGLVAYVFLIVIVLRNRKAVASLIRPRPGTPAADRTGAAARIRDRIAATWHIVAVFYLVALWLVWAVDIPQGFERLLRFFVVTTVVTIVARLVLTAALGMLDGMLDIDPELDRRYPGLEARMRFYHPLLSGMVRTVVFLVTALLLAEVWGFDGFDWFAASSLGQRMASALLTIGVTVLAAAVAWEAANAAIQRHLAALQREAQAARSARLRTLLPMLRTVLMITILVVVALMILSEIGVNIAPLLAGAGVLGIAIGFGSQKLVQDVITGLFLLLENTMQVGDVVTLGGLTGVVEYLSIRTIRLRAEDGSLHVIPFSAVTTVTNMTRDFSHAVIEAQVSYKDDYDMVVEVLRGIVREMRAEPRWQNEIRDDLEVMGLQRFADSAVVIKCRIRCGPFGRWSVGREFNRRMKLAFDENGIEIPFPHQKMIFDQPGSFGPGVTG
jgi:small-conductance mechanosensitive channel